ncbi:conserved protein of unknown function [Xenorhabdus poinarii G6]|uniref:Uncharacterized protein n=1 Tax=Xenorhabdus poinarii G6 TaxID=1354304 RepID=A0A068R162_9GAMM|nr:hypothetical protein [Xenorhabdus poinarii]CDG19825.1 conserved protein of unknown function [Xenorhabdus poinarii G6]
MQNTDINITYSLHSNANLIIGQTIVLTVTITLPPGKLLPSNSSVSFSQGVNIYSDSNAPKHFIQSSHNKNIYIATFNLEVSSATQDDSYITFNITPNNIPDISLQTFKCKAININTVNLDSMALNLSQPYLNIPADGAPNFPPDNGSHKSSAVTATIKNKNNQYLANAPIFITSSLFDDIDKISIYASNTASSSQIYPQILDNSTKGFFINSDNQGNIVFYIYPKNSLSEIVEFISMIPGVDDSSVYAIQKLYIINSDPPSFLKSLPFPIVWGLDRGNLYASPGIRKFDVSVEYPDAKEHDIILFFINSNYSGYNVLITDPQCQIGESNTVAKLPYQIFELNKPSKFSYVVINQRGDMRASLHLPVTYTGGTPYEPDPDVKRDYASCIVHTSLGVRDYNIIPNNNAVNYAAIMKYVHGDGTGLYIEILSEQSGGTPAIPNGTQITLNLYLNSQNKNYIRTYPAQPIKKQVDNTFSAIIHVPCTDLVNVETYEGGAGGNIYFDYSFTLDTNKKAYGKKWNASIVTIPADNDPNPCK